CQLLRLRRCQFLIAGAQRPLDPRLPPEPAAMLSRDFHDKVPSALALLQVSRQLLLRKTWAPNLGTFTGHPLKKARVINGFKSLRRKRLSSSLPDHFIVELLSTRRSIERGVCGW